MNARIVTLSDWLLPWTAVTEKGRTAHCINIMSTQWWNTDTLTLTLQNYYHGLSVQLRQAEHFFEKLLKYNSSTTGVQMFLFTSLSLCSYCLRHMLLSCAELTWAEPILVLIVLHLSLHFHIGSYCIAVFFSHLERKQLKGSAHCLHGHQAYLA